MIEVEIRDGQVSPSPATRVRVEHGDTVRIVLTSDRADELHVHGYDLEESVAAGGTATLEFSADQSGSFEVEAHELDPPLLFTLQVR
ncbi:MAG: cupredoxin domain-containing protein [Sporichthyaceae bacterium]|nr:cupredoxin domain-containing protein [Sporichthyaceae bacterium]